MPRGCKVFHSHSRAMAALSLGLAAAPAMAQSIAASLSAYENTLKVASVAGAAGTSSSGRASRQTSSGGFT